MKFLFLFLLAPHSYAYIPEYSLIASHTAGQHGKGVYQIEQDVTYHKDGDAFSVHESWLVAGENEMRVTLEGRGPLKGLVHGTILFDGGKKYFVDPNGTLRSQRLGADWLEPLFHFRNSKFLRSRLVALKIAPPESLHDRAPMPSDEDPKYTPPPFIRLNRVGGAIAWAIGAAPDPNEHPTLWIEQDQFVIRKYRGADDSMLKADDYAKYGDLWFPHRRIYDFEKSEVEIDTQMVRSLGRYSARDTRFRTSSLSASRDGLKLPDADVLHEFYLRFR